MKKCISFVSASIALLVPLAAHANNGTWTMPYSGSCSGTCVEVLSSDVGLGGYGDNVGVWGSTINGTGVRAQSSNWLGVDASGLVGVKGSGISGVQGFGWTYGMEANGGTAPIYLSGTIPSVGGATLCKSTSGSSAGHIGICSSNRALKEDIRDLGLSVETLMQLRPRTFAWKSNHAADIGFIAEEVASVNPILAVYSEEGRLEGVKYTQLTALLTRAMQDQVHERNRIEEDLRKQVSDLTGQLREQQKLIGSLASRLGAIEERAVRRQ